MNGRVSKTIRHLIYGDDLPRERSYREIGRTIECTGKRREYQDAKKKHKMINKEDKK